MLYMQWVVKFEGEDVSKNPFIGIVVSWMSLASKTVQHPSTILL